MFQGEDAVSNTLHISPPRPESMSRMLYAMVGREALSGDLAEPCIHR